MTMEFTVLASGSSGNASFLCSESFGLLIDVGLGPRQLESRLAMIDHSWSDVQAVILTHTHGDHWNERTLNRLVNDRIPFYCHSEHGQWLQRRSQSFVKLQSVGLVRYYQPDTTVTFSPHLSCKPFPVRHDSGMTCGFRLEGAVDFFGQPTVLAYAADLGSWDEQIVKHLSDADLLALEFNHDIMLQKASGRSAHTIARNLGHAGHLSNDQAAALILAVLNNSYPGCPQQIVQLHLSESCNRPALAQGVMQPIIQNQANDLEVHVSYAGKPTPRFVVGGGFRRKTRKRQVRLPRRKLQPKFITPFLPGFQE